MTTRWKHASSHACRIVHSELEAANAEIEHVLTPAQRATFKKMRMHLLHERHADKD